MADADKNGFNPVDKSVENTPAEVIEKVSVTKDTKPQEKDVTEDVLAKPADSSENIKNGEDMAAEANPENGESETGKPAPMMKTKAQINYKNHKANVKYDPSKLSASSDPDAIRKQVCSST